MPRTKFQEVVFAALMCFFMVLAMELYNTAFRFGGMSNACWIPALMELRIMLPICFVMSFFFLDPLAQRIAFAQVAPGVDKPILVTLVRAGVTVALMCPTMSLIATLLFKEPSFGTWVHTWGCNMPMALIWQLLYCGPLCRFLFRLLFRVKGNQPAQAH